jgi:gluconolactonase
MNTILWITMPAALAVLAAGVFIQLGLNPLSWGALAQLPSTAQIINQKTFNVLSVVPSPSQANASTVRGIILLVQVLCSL